MATNKKPPKTVTVPVHLPEDLHYKAIRLAPRGKMSDLIVECATDEVEARWRKWLKQELAKASAG